MKESNKLLTNDIANLARVLTQCKLRHYTLMPESDNPNEKEQRYALFTGAGDLLTIPLGSDTDSLGIKQESGYYTPTEILSYLEGYDAGYKTGFALASYEK